MADIFTLFQQIEKKKENTATPPTHMIVGLGNPGKEYAYTRHNAGFMAVDHLAHVLGVTLSLGKFHSLCNFAMLGERRVLLMKPTTMMNASGEAVRDAAVFYKIPPENILVLVDDIYQDPGHMRVRKNGSDGGQRGLKSIIYQLASDQFPRIRFGVGKKPHPDYDLAAWVLGVLPTSDQEKIASCFPLLETAAAMIFDGKWETVMSLCNGHHPDKD